MKTVIRKLYIILFLSVVALNLLAQTNYSGLEYIENKGQWDKQVTFKSNLNGGAIFLRKTGFTILQHNQQDLTAIAESNHGHESIAQKAGTANSSATGRFPKPGSENGGGGVPSSGLTKLRSHAYTLDFEGSNQNPQIIPEKAQDTYNNYFIGDDRSKWQSNCKIYQAVTYKDVYPGIDIRYYSDAGWVKYEFIVNAGADPSKIVMKFSGVDKLGLSKNELVINTSVGEIRELSPYTYQYEENTRKKLNCKYVVEGNRVRFKLGKYSSAAPLVIDPTLIFASLSGSTADNWGYTATYGRDGSLYGGGIVFGAGFPTSVGAFQTTYTGGEFDIGIIKLNTSGTSRIYATYIGGDQKEQPHSMFEDAQGNLVIAGRTNSTNYPALTSFGTKAGWDIVVTKLNGNGSALIGSMRIGGSGDDGVNTDENREAGRKNLLNFYGDDARSEVILDPSGNIYVASSTWSTNFYTTPGALQTTLRGKQDAVLIKINPTVSAVLSSTYFGGDGYDAGFVLARDPSNGNIYMAGGTASTDLPGNKAGVIQPAYSGGATADAASDGYIAVFAPDASTLIRSTYLGTSDVDVILGIQFDKFNFPYVMGVSMGGTWPVVNATFSVGRAKQFVGKLKEDLSAWEFSTVFGSASSDYPNISPVAFLVDRCQNMYISGWGGDWGDRYKMDGVNGMPLTPDAIKSTSPDNKDFYFIVIKRNATQVLYGSFFGQNGPIGEHVDGGTSRYDQQGTIYQGICANCGGAAPGSTKPRWPVTPGAWCCSSGISAARSGGECNLGMVKIAFNFAGVAAGVRAFINGVYDTTGCVPMDVIFRDTIRNAQNYIWNFGDGSPDSLTSNFEIAHTYTAVGDYRVRLIAIDSNSCNFKDTAYVTVRVRDNQALLDFSATKIGQCLLNDYRFDNLSVAPPGIPFGPKSFSWDFGDGTKIDSIDNQSINHSYLNPGTYKVSLTLLDTSYCNAPETDTLSLRVSPLVKAQFEVPTEVCAPFTAVFNNTTLAGQTFEWNFGDGTGSTLINPTHIYAIPGTYTVTLKAYDPSTCNLEDSTSKVINVRGAPTAAFTYTPTVPTENITHIFTNGSTPDAVRFVWHFGDGDTLATSSRADVDHEYNSTGTFNACLYAYNQIGCVDTACLPVTTIVSPRLDVPNAFTPTGPNNNIIYIRGFAIGKMRFVVYNRWGQRVFESNSKNQGWDGKFNGVVQPMDVYAYTLEVEFTDGTRATKKGDITLIR